MGCAGPGLEPPNESSQGTGGLGMMPAGGMGAGASGTGGVGGASGMAGAAGAGGFGNSGGSGGGSGTGAQTGGTGGLGGAGGTSGPAGGTGGAGGTMTEPDGGVSDGGAPILECEESREIVDVSVFGFPLTSCMIAATDGVLTHGDAFAVAITTVGGEETKWPDRKDMSEECGEDEAFIFNAALDLPRIDLCPALCEAFLAAQDAGVTVELIYGCDPPE